MEPNFVHRQPENSTLPSNVNPRVFMSTVGQREKETQQRVIKVFRDTLR